MLLDQSGGTITFERATAKWDQKLQDTRTLKQLIEGQWYIGIPRSEQNDLLDENDLDEEEPDEDEPAQIGS